MSMDVSSGSHAVAALLEGRMGMVCELQLGQDSSVDPQVRVLAKGGKRSYQTMARGVSIFSSQPDDLRNGIDAAGGQSRFAEPSDSQVLYIESIDVQSNYQATSLHGLHNQRAYAQSDINHTSNLDLQGQRRKTLLTNVSDYDQNICTLPIEDGTSTFYWHLCSEDDPPRSGKRQATDLRSNVWRDGRLATLY
jgi:hypothetical protein